MLRLAACADWWDGMFRPAHHQRFLDLNSARAFADHDLSSQQGPRGAETPDARRQPQALAPVAWSEARLVVSDEAQRFSVMSTAEHKDWARGGEAASEVELRIWDALQAAGDTGRIEVLTPSGALAFHLDLSAPQRSIGADSPDDVRLPREIGPAPGSVETALIDVRLEDSRARAEQDEMVHEAPRALLEQIAALRNRLDASRQGLPPTRQRDQGMGR